MTRAQNVRDTSIDAYRAFVAGPDLPRQQRQIVDFLAAHPGCTRGEIAERTGIRLTSVCGRTAELIERGAIEEFSRRPCSVTGVNAHVLRLARVQRELFGEAA